MAKERSPTQNQSFGLRLGLCHGQAFCLALSRVHLLIHSFIPSLPHSCSEYLLGVASVPGLH